MYIRCQSISYHISSTEGKKFSVNNKTAHLWTFIMDEQLEIYVSYFFFPPAVIQLQSYQCFHKQLYSSRTVNTLHKKLSLWINIFSWISVSLVRNGQDIMDMLHIILKASQASKRNPEHQISTDYILRLGGN